MPDYSSVIVLPNPDGDADTVETALIASGADFIRIGPAYYLLTETKTSVFDLVGALQQSTVAFSLVHIGARRGAFVAGSGMNDQELQKARDLINDDYNYDRLEND